MKEINIIRDYYDKNDFVYKKNVLTLKEGISVLVGCNGSGKSTLMNEIKDRLREENIKYYEYDNEHQGGHTAMSAALFNNNLSLLARHTMSSEGEKIAINTETIALQLGEYIRRYKDYNEYFVFFDAMDSGLSIDNIIEFKAFLNDCVIPDIRKNGKEIYIVITSNSYEMGVNENCLLIPELKYKTIKSYDEYKKHILSSRDYKNKRYDKINNKKRKKKNGWH